MNNFWQRFALVAGRAPDREAILYQRRASVDCIRYDALQAKAEQFAAHLAALGVAPMDRCAILGENSPAWCAAYLGILRLGAIAVPIDRTYAPGQVETLVADSGATVLLASAACRPCADAARERASQTFTIAPLAWDLEADAPHALGPCPAGQEDPAVILYTSGTTSDPKGVVLTHGNILAAVAGMFSALPIGAQDRSLGALPLFHILSQISGLLLPLAEGASVVMLEEVNAGEVLRALRERGITVLCSVPQFFYLIHERILQQIAQRGPAARLAARSLMALSGFVRARLGFNLGAVVFRRVHAICGPDMRFFVSAGAAFDPHIARDLHRLGFDILQAYGLTESTGAATVSPRNDVRGETVGVPIAGMSVKVIAPSGEVCAPEQEGEIALRGQSMTPGYYRRPEATAAVFRDDWFMTGDLGFFDSSGHLRISGRSKDVIVLDSGKNIYPEEIERHLERSPVIKEVCVVGRRSGATSSSERLFAAVVPDMAALRQRRITNVRDYLRNEIDTLCAQLPPHKRVTGFEVMIEDLPRTTTRKIKRFVVLQQLDALGQAQEGRGPRVRPYSAEDRAWADSPDVADILRLIQAQSPAAPAQIHPNDSLDIDLQFDSLGRIDLIVALETMLDAKLPAGKGAECYTVRDLANALIEVLPEQRSAHDGKAVTGWPKVLAEGLATPAGEGPKPSRGPGLEALRFCVLKVVRLLGRVLVRLDVRGTPNLGIEGPFLLCVNHQSYLDAVLLFSAMPPPVVRRTMSLGKTRVFSHFGLRWVAARYDVAVVDADSNLVQAMQISARALRDGKILLLFPEGERSIDGEIAPLRRGAAVLSAYLKLPIVPVVIEGPYRIWPRGRSFQGLAPVTITFLPPLAPPSEVSTTDAASFEHATIRLTEDLQGRMEAALKAMRSAA